jgi:AraC-like DNA-binding protein
MFATPIPSIPPVPEVTRHADVPLQSPAHLDAQRIVAHFVERGVLREQSRASGYVHAILAAPPETLRVDRIARRVYASRRTLGRCFRTEGLPTPIDWVALARAVRAHRAILRGGPLRIAAAAGGYPDQFAMSNAIHRIIGIRPSKLRNVSQGEVLDVWICRQRERGTLIGAPTTEHPSCPLCGVLRAS